MSKAFTRILALAACVVTGLLLAPAAGASSPSVYWGATVGPHLTGSPAPYDMTAADRFEEMVGKRMSLMGFTLPWASCAEQPCTFHDFPATQMEAIRRRGSIPVFGWASYSQPLSADQPDFKLSKIAGGAYDEYLRSWARDAKAWGHSFFLNFDWEMNLDGVFPYVEKANGNQPGDFVRMWRHVHRVFEQEGATNATWVWCPNIGYNGSLDIPPLYPGDAYVDWTCIDGYNWWYNWTPFAAMLGPTYDIVQSVAPTKPLLIGETASTEMNGSKAAWITDMLQQQLPTRFRNVKGVMWYEQQDPRFAEQDPAGWVVESSASARSAFAAGIAAPYYATNTFEDVDAPVPPLSPVTPPGSTSGGSGGGSGSGSSAGATVCSRQNGQTVCVRRCTRKLNRRTGRRVLVCRKLTLIRNLVVKPRIARTLRPASPGLAAAAGISLSLVEDATVTMRLQRRVARRWVAVPGGLRFHLTQGTRGILFGGRLSDRRTVPAGTYRVTLTPVDSAGRTGKTVAGRFVLRAAG